MESVVGWEGNRHHYDISQILILLSICQWWSRTHTPKSHIWEIIYFCRGGNTIWWLWKLNLTSTSTLISTNSIWWMASWVCGQPNRVGKVKSIWWTRLWLLKVKLSSPTRFPPLVRVATQTRSSYGPPYTLGVFQIKGCEDFQAVSQKSHLKNLSQSWCFN